MERGWVVLAGSIHGTAVSLWERAAGRGPVLNDEDQGQARKEGSQQRQRSTLLAKLDQILRGRFLRRDRIST